VNKSWWALLAVAVAMTSVMAGLPPVGAENEGSAKEFELALPEGIEGARRVVLELSEVRLPRKAAVVFRVRAVDEVGEELPLGSVGLMAESNHAEGTATHAVLRIDVTNTLKRWRQDHPAVGAMRIRVVPYAGTKPLEDLEWSTASAVLALAR
jgi:hypothetical protein